MCSCIEKKSNIRQVYKIVNKQIILALVYISIGIYKLYGYIDTIDL